jgi:hypothetical protein
MTPQTEIAAPPPPLRTTLYSAQGAAKCFGWPECGRKDRLYRLGNQFIDLVNAKDFIRGCISLTHPSLPHHDD